MFPTGVTCLTRAIIAHASPPTGVFILSSSLLPQFHVSETAFVITRDHLSVHLFACPFPIHILLGTFLDRLKYLKRFWNFRVSVCLALDLFIIFVFRGIGRKTLVLSINMFYFVLSLDDNNIVLVVCYVSCSAHSKRTTRPRWCGRWKEWPWTAVRGLVRTREPPRQGPPPAAKTTRTWKRPNPTDSKNFSFYTHNITIIIILLLLLSLYKKTCVSLWF